MQQKDKRFLKIKIFNLIQKFPLLFTSLIVLTISQENKQMTRLFKADYKCLIHIQITGNKYYSASGLEFTLITNQSNLIINKQIHTKYRSQFICILCWCYITCMTWNLDSVICTIVLMKQLLGRLIFFYFSDVFSKNKKTDISSSGGIITQNIMHVHVYCYFNQSSTKITLL